MSTFPSNSIWSAAINGVGSVGLAVGGTEVGGRDVGATVGAWVGAAVADGGIGVDAIAVGWAGGGAHAPSSPATKSNPVTNRRVVMFVSPCPKNAVAITLIARLR